MPTETTLNSLKVHKVPDFETWEENYNQTNGIGTSDVVVIPPEELKKGILPDQTNNSGKFLTTDGNGNTSWATVDALPSQSGNSGKYLKTNGSVASWENAPITSVNSKTGAVTLDNTDVGAAASSHSHGNITNEGDITATAPTIANGDQIIINDNSASKITNGPTFDGSTTTKYLSQKGTWESVPTINYPVTSVNSKTGAVSLSASDVSAVATSAVGANSGVAPLNASGKIDSTYLPSYVDDVIEGYYYNSKFYTTSAHTTEITGETGKIFVDLSTNKTYRYGGSSFTEISQGSIVSVSRDLTSGTKIGTLTINGTGTDLYAPTPETFTVTGGASTIVSDNLTASRALISNSSGKVVVSDVTSTELGYLDGVTSAIQTQIDGKQAKVTASGILKGDGSGGVSAATAGTDYQTPLTIDSTPTDGNTTHVVSSDGTYDKILARTKIYTASCSTGASTAAKVATLDDSSGFNLATGVTVAVRFTYGNSATTPTLRVDGSTTGTAKTIAIPSSVTAYTTGNGTTYNTWGAYETVLFTYTGTYWTHIPSGYLGYLAYNLANSKQDAGNYKTIQTAVSDPTASGNSTTFIDTISQNTNGVISVTKKNVNFPVTSVNSKTGAVTLTASDVGALPSSTTIPTVPTMDSTPTNGNSNNTVSSDGVYDMIMGRTKVYTATCSTAAATAAKVATLDDSTGFSLVAGVKVAVTFTYGNSATTPTLNVNSSGAKTIAIPSSVTAYTTGNGTTYNTWGAYETVLFTYTGTYWAHDTSGYLGYLAYNTASGRQAKITASGILKGDGSGGVSAAVSGTDYQAPLPSQTNNSGKFLTTNGSAMSWGTVDALPSQTGNSGKYLTTNGSTASWTSISIPTVPTMDASPTDGNSSNTVSSNGVYDMVMGRTKIYTGSCSTAASTAAKVVTLDDATGFSLTTGVKVAVTFSKANEATSPTLNVNSTGAKSITYYASGDPANFMDGAGTTHNSWGEGETLIFTYESGGWVHSPSGFFVDCIYNLANDNKLPSQSGNSGKYLTTNGTIASWGDSVSGSLLDIDSTPTANSDNLITSGALYNSVKRTDSIDAANTSYSTKMARAIYATTTDLTAGTTSLTSGVIALVYEV